MTSSKETVRAFNKLVRQSMKFGDVIRAAVYQKKEDTETPNLSGRRVTYLALLVGLNMVFVALIIKFPDPSFLVGGIAVFALSLPVFFFSFFFELFFFWRNPFSVMNSLPLKSAFDRNIRLWIRMLDKVGTDKLVVEWFDEKIVLSKDEGNLLIRIKPFNVTTVVFPSIRVAEFAAQERWEENDEDSLDVYLVHEIFAELQWCEKVGLSPEYRKFIFSTQVPKEILLEGAKRNIAPKTLLTFAKHNIPSERWEELKGYPAEWIETVK